MPLLFVILSLFCLLLTKKRMTSDLSHLVHRLGGSQHSVIIVWSTIFLPGTLIHEISHFLVAALTGARTGKIEIFPEYLEDKLDEKSTHVALGSVQTQKLNPIQGFLVGIAPFISGMALLIWFASLFQTSFTAKDIWLLLLEGYLFFTVANSFFPSWTDIKHTLTFIILAAVALVVAWFFGFQILLSPDSQIWIITDSLWAALFISVCINITLTAPLSLTNLLLRKRRK